MRARILLLVACILLAIFAYDGVVRLLLIGLVRLPKLPAELTVLTSILALFSLTHAWYSIGGRLTLAFFGLNAVISWAFEQVGVATGLVYGAYHYTDYLGPKLGQVPYLIPLAWFMMIYPSYVIANLALEQRATGTPAGVSRLVRLAAVSAAVMTAWDLVVDPILSGPSARAWIWETGGPYFGIPIQNYVGWLLTTFAVYLAYRALEQRVAPAALGSVGAGPVGAGVAALPVAAYGLMLASNLLSGVAPAGVAIIGPLVMGPPVVVAAWRLWRLRRSPAPLAGGRPRQTWPVGGWIDRVKADPLPWLLDEETPAVRHLALRGLLDRPSDDPEVVAARAKAMRADPIASILAAQNPEGWWVKPGHGYSPKYTGTVWQVIFLDQLGADGDDPRVRAACEYVLEHAQSSGGGFGALGSGLARPAPSGVVHCLNGNLLRALIGFGMLEDPRVGRSLAYQAASITGEGMERWYSLTPGPGFRCGANYGDPCAWGATKAVLALARVPAERRTPAVARAIEEGAAFLLSRDPSVADYPMGPNTKPSSSWFKIGFPSGYVADVLQTLEALCEAGMAADPRLDRAIDWIVDRQDAGGRWPNRYSYAGKMAIDIDRPGRPSKWVTLRACRVLKAASEATKDP